MENLTEEIVVNVIDLTFLYNDETKDLISTDNGDFLEVLKSEGYRVVSESFYQPLVNKELAQQRILELKQLLASTDWKIIVNAELIQAGLDVKYPNLHNERQAWRNEISELEN